MEIYDSLLGAVCDEYDRVTLIKKSERGEVTLIRHRASGNRYIFRHFSGSSEVYRKLLTVSCPNLPQIMEVGEKEGKTALLEEYVQGDTLGEILQGGLLTAAQAKQITRQLCMALWVLHSLGVVHRDVKPDNVIIRGTEAVLIDFDASRIYKNENREDTQILGTTGFAAPEQYGLSQSDGRADIYAPEFYVVLRETDQERESFFLLDDEEQKRNIFCVRSFGFDHEDFIHFYRKLRWNVPGRVRIIGTKNQEVRNLRKPNTGMCLLAALFLGYVVPKLLEVMKLF